tara:strand:+ start:225 stop:476 length:252 start_codon:yes stop_codon:yes gene_type:complete
MDRELERYIITGLVLILLVLGLSGCGANTIQVIEEEEQIEAIQKQEAEVLTVQKLEGIAHALGCMFAPASCQEKKDLGKTEDK